MINNAYELGDNGKILGLRLTDRWASRAVEINGMNLMLHNTWFVILCNRTRHTIMIKIKYIHTIIINIVGTRDG